MKYIPTPNLWDPAISRLIEEGRLQLQVGQWVRCGDARPSRLVSISKQSVWAIHPYLEKGAQNRKWLELVRERREDRKRSIANRRWEF